MDFCIYDEDNMCDQKAYAHMSFMHVKYRYFDAIWGKHLSLLAFPLALCLKSNVLYFGHCNKKRTNKSIFFCSFSCLFVVADDTMKRNNIYITRHLYISTKNVGNCLNKANSIKSLAQFDFHTFLRVWNISCTNSSINSSELICFVTMFEIHFCCNNIFLNLKSNLC